ncbi:hypothetical protein JR316_0006919 [Psilocybe cubensis]|uniref:Uncharacterized protein n=2 Tax=Psilocybe cubensis TaxID=181762 RepID=A0ACB8GXF8_PSICU|nr:hypothetical protein JR316_0006919 [Psilocybe cubensis]KAH9480321.1 hypothetical protein JR316_0006919 [Psilocybe cubensis]
MANRSYVEHLAFTASEGFLADKSLFDQLKVWLDNNITGFLKVFWGFEVQEPTHAHIFVLWKSPELHKQASQHPEFHSGFMPLFSKLFTAPGPSVHLIDYDNDPTNAFSAAVTEFAIVKPKEGHTQAEIDEVAELIKAGVAGQDGIHLPLVRGPVVNSDQSDYAQAAGWDSIEAHLKVIQTPSVAALGGKIFGIAHMDFKHIVLKEA